VALGAILNSPGNLDPAAGKQQAADLLERYQYTLNGMVELGKITSSERSQIYSKLAEVPEADQRLPARRTEGLPAQHVERELLANGFTEEQINGGGLEGGHRRSMPTRRTPRCLLPRRTPSLRAAGDKKAAKKLH